MAKIVDIEQRRTLIAEACWRTIVRRGIAGATTREIAAEAGITRGLLFHYYADKDQMINGAWQLLLERFRERFAASLERTTDSLDVVRAMAYTNLPLDNQQRLEFGVWLTMWAHGFGNRKLRLEQQALYQGWRERLAAAIQQATDDGLLRSDLDPMLAATHLTGLTDGLIVQLLVDPEHPHVAALASKAVDDLIASWTVPTKRRSAARRTTPRVAPATRSSTGSGRSG